MAGTQMSGRDSVGWEGSEEGRSSDLGLIEFKDEALNSIRYGERHLWACQKLVITKRISSDGDYKMRNISDLGSLASLCAEQVLGVPRFHKGN